MTLTTDYIAQKFAHFNALFFHSELETPPFVLSRARSFLGRVTCKRRRRLLGGWRYSDFEFVISRQVALLADETEREDVILHEMIHYYILSRQLQDSSAHGRIFRQMMADINARHGRHITIRHKRTADEAARDCERRHHLVAVVRLTDGTTGVAVAAGTRILRLWDEFAVSPRVAEAAWYSTTDPYFNKFPKVRTAKVYAADAAELHAHLAGARRLARQGNCIFAASPDAAGQ